MTRRMERFSLRAFFAATVLVSFFAVAVHGFGLSSLGPRSSVKLAAKKTKEPRATEVIFSPEKDENGAQIPRATRTLYKPRSTEVIGVSETEVLAIEREIQESTKARLDMKRVAELLEDDVEAEEQTATSDWEVSLAAGGVAAIVALGTTDSWVLATIALASVYFLANGDPLEEQTPAGECFCSISLHSFYYLADSHNIV